MQKEESVMNNPLNTLKKFTSQAGGCEGYIYSLRELEKSGYSVSRLPVSVRIVLESLLRNCDGKRVSESDVKNLASWSADKPGNFEVPFVVSRIILQDFTGVPLLVDLAAMRSAAEKAGKDPELVEPLVPVDLVIDHSVQMDFAGTPDAFEKNLEKEFERNRERYEFLKWGQNAFKTFSVVPPATGIIHQVNLEYLARMVFKSEAGGATVIYPDTLVGTDSHTTMINGLGIVGWGVGGIEAEAGMLGQPVCFKCPEVVGVRMRGTLSEGVCSTDLALHVTNILRKENVVGKFVEFFGDGARSLSLADRATVANMAPEYGATMGYFPVDETTLDYLRLTGRDEKLVALTRDYFSEQGIFGIPGDGECDYTKVVDLDLGDVVASIAGPKRPQDRINLSDAKEAFEKLLSQTGRDSSPSVETSKGEIRNGSVLIAAITSCTNTSNPYLLVAAGLLAKKASSFGLRPPKYVKATLAPGSRVVGDYLKESGLQKYLDELGFNLAGYGCATCIGNSGPLDAEVSEAVKGNDLLCASVLSGNRNFEARIHPLIKANYLMSPPLVVAFALAGKINIDFSREPLGKSPDGKDVFLSDIWPSSSEISELLACCVKSEMFRRRYSDMGGTPQWKAVKSSSGALYKWDAESTYIQQPPFFRDFSFSLPKKAPFENLKALAILGDSVTTDHISPAGAIAPDGPAGRYLRERGVEQKDFNSFGSRRGNDRVMTRGTFANVRIKNLMAGGAEGGWTKIDGRGENVSIFDAACEYAKRGQGLIVFGGRDYGMGSSRDWAAKGSALLGVRAVIAKSFERIHRSNLVGMGVLPLEFEDGTDASTLGLTGGETFAIENLDEISVGKKVFLSITRQDGKTEKIPLVLRIDTPIEIEYFKEGGILPYVLKKILEK